MPDALTRPDWKPSMNGHSSSKKRPPKITSTGTVFRPLVLLPTSDQLVVTTVELVSTSAFISDHSRPLTRLW
ncbi:hypothetical protein PanWU01x14_063280 [Parasponia andersonii]|uniref:Uncharacterized protein n=1 Tax=Parasponia andersonii TaxID=3476 RepID=A0A2P5DHR1_PARAD|nr:hypothetical protein PanWU01x14_063280 [Parasponia andersonii]